MRSSLFWNAVACNNTKAHRYAWDNRAGTLQFLAPNNLASSQMLSTVKDFTNAFIEDLAEEGYAELAPDATIVDEQFTFIQQFDVETFPYEYHWLEFTLSAPYSRNVVNFTLFPIEIDSLDPSVPPGWNYERTECFLSYSGSGRAASDLSVKPIEHGNFKCHILVTRDNTGWWMTSFLLFVGINVISFVQGVGRTSHMLAEARDDKDAARGALFDGMRMNGIFSIGLLLTYVFQVQQSPYNQPIEFWPHVPASSLIYILGLFGILMAAALPIIMGLFMKKALLVEGFVGGPMQAYNLADIPKEGEAPESDQPLLHRSKDGTFAEADDFPENRSEGERMTRNGEESPAVRYPPVAESRKKTQKEYRVLSVEEAALLNRLIGVEFWILIFIPICMLVFGLWILLTARSDFQSAV